MDETGYPVPETLNSRAALRHFRQPGFLTGTHEFVRAAIRHRFTGAFIALALVMGLVGILATFG